MKRLIFTAAMAGLTVALPVAAQERQDVPVTDTDVRINQIIVYGDDPCPVSTPDEIVVCARKGENERFRIPEPLRGDPADPARESWANRAQQFEYVGQSGIGSCSPVGAGGFTGCFGQLMRQARAERMGAGDISWVALVEEERRKRLEQLDAQAEAIEQELREQQGEQEEEQGSGDDAQP